MYYDNNTTIYLNGKWMKAQDATTGLYGQTMHYGNGVFEGIRAYDTGMGPQIFKAREHYERLLYSAGVMDIQLDYTVEQLITLTYELLDCNGWSDAYIRPLVFTGADMSLRTSTEVNLMLCAWEWGKYLGNTLLNVMTSSFERPNPKSCFVEAKVTGHYTNSILACNEAKKKGFDEALLLDMNGFVAEAPGANFFYEQDGTLYTCPKGNILSGITRATIMELAQNAGITVEEKLFTIEDVKGADSAFFTGTAAEVAGIASLDKVPFRRRWKESLGYQLSEMYSQKIRQADLVRKAV